MRDGEADPTSPSMLPSELPSELSPQPSTQPSTQRLATSAGAGWSRRRLLQGAAAAGLLSAGPVGTAHATQAPSVSAAAGRIASPPDWSAFDAAVRSAFDRMGMVGAAVAVVSRDEVLHTLPLGRRGVTGARPVTTGSHFLVASTTKSMSALLVATYVDEGRLGWDQRVVEVWPGFRAPTDELTRSLRVRDLLGMATGIGEPPALSALHEGDPTAPQLLQSIVNLPVIAAPGREYFYNNTVFAVGGYLPLLAGGVAPADLPAAYSRAMQERVFGPAAMTSARMTDDPRGLVDDFVTGSGLDLRGRASAQPFAPVGSYAPVGGTLATLDDMASYVRLQLREGRSVNGRRVASAANLTECWRPHITMPTSPDFDPSAVSSGYAMGWIRETFTDGSSLVWHNGGIDGFTAFVGFLPERDLGLVVLNGMNPGPTGALFYTYVLNRLLSDRFGLNAAVPDRVLAAYTTAVDTLVAQGRTARGVSPQAVAPFEGCYEGGYQLTRSGRELVVALGPRRMPLQVLPDGSYLVAGGLLLGATVHLRPDADGVPLMEIVGLETVRRTTGTD